MKLSAAKKSHLKRSMLDVRHDELTRNLYATDASIYQIQPAAVAFPRGAGEMASLFEVAAEAGLSVIPRGSGSGLAGGAIGDGLIMDCQRHNQQIHSLDLERRSVRVGPGVVLDALNAYLRPHGFQFGPDVATSARASLGGMIANNSSGARVAAHGVTGDHVRSLEIVLSDGRRLTLGDTSTPLPQAWSALTASLLSREKRIRQTYPEGMVKRWHGYGLRPWLEQPERWTHVLSGSEGTLAVIAEAELKIVSLPKEKGLGLLFFDGVKEAMQASVAVADLKPSAVEHIDHILFDQTRGQLAFQGARELLGLDAHPCASILMIEFQEDVADRLSALERRGLGCRSLMLHDALSMERVWHLRKAGLSLLTGCKGPSKPTTGIEDTAVCPDRLPEYVQALQDILSSQKLDACFYGHAASGLLHIRPVVNLQCAEDRERFRVVADEVSRTVRAFRGSLAAEHGVGIARTEFLEDHIGPDLMCFHQEIKHAFDPDNRLNPGKILEQGRDYRIDTHLRPPVESHVDFTLPSPHLTFVRREEQWLDNLAQCNGCAGCRKLSNTMCPTFQATGEELMSTRGRANIIREWLGSDPANGTSTRMLHEALDHCLACKACQKECPSNVDMAFIKAELQQMMRDRHGTSLAQWFYGYVDRVAQLGALFPHFSNWVQSQPIFQKCLQLSVDLAEGRPLPIFARQRFDQWFHGRHAKSQVEGATVYLWDDTFVRYYDSHVGRAAVHVLEHLGFDVRLLQQHGCCGRPSFSQGDLRRARRLGRSNVAYILDHLEAPLLFLEPSCHSMFVQEYMALGVAGSKELAGRCHLIETYLADQLAAHPEWHRRFLPLERPLAMHDHCHVQSLSGTSDALRLAQQIWPTQDLRLLKSGCCGMAGAFGMMQRNQQISRALGERLLASIEAFPSGGYLAASGTSCRHQMESLSAHKPRHLVELLAECIPGK
jgi:FAD/FMN-containing dehydrogenase/Fe-S oxidoreductase